MAVKELLPDDTESELSNEEVDRRFDQMTEGLLENDQDLSNLTDSDKLPSNFNESRHQASPKVSPQDSKPAKETSGAKPGVSTPGEPPKPGKGKMPSSPGGSVTGSIGGAKKDDSLKVAAAKITAQVAEQNYGGAALSVIKNKKTRNAAIVGLAVPVVLMGLIAFFILNILANPFEFIKNVVTDKPTRRFVIQAAEAVGVPGASAAKALNERLGYAVPINNSNTAFADHIPNKPEPGSIDEIIANIDWQKAQWEYGNPNSCNYRFTFTPYINYDHKTIHQIDKVFQKGTGKEIPLDQADASVSTCFMGGYPLFNLATRSPNAREVNKSSKAYLSYLTDKSKLDNQPVEKVDEELQKKTLTRVTDKKDQAPKTDDEKIQQFADKVYTDIEKGEDPNELDYDKIAQEVGLTFPGDGSEQDPEQVTNSMCSYYKIFTESDNVVRAVQTRHNVAVRNGLKFLSLSGSGALYKNSNKETNYTMSSISNWASAAGYSLNVDGTTTGVQATAESLHNRAFIIPPIEAQRLGEEFRQGCVFVSLGNIPLLGSFIQRYGESKVLALYQDFQKLVTAESDGIFELGNTNNFGLRDILIASFKVVATGGATGTETGPQNFNRSTMGVEQLTSDYLRTIGGRFLTEAERNELAIKVESDARREQQNKSMLARLFDTKSPRSIASRLASQNTSLKDSESYIASLTKSLSTPLQSVASIFHQANFVATGQNNTAFAASSDTANYFKIDLAGFSEAELKSVNLLDNARAIEKLKKDIDETDDIRIKQMRYYDECFKKQELTSPILFTRIPIDGKIENKTPTDQKKYLYIREGFKLGGEAPELIMDFDKNNPKVDSDFFKVYTCETLLKDENPLEMAKIDKDFAKRYRLYAYYRAQMTNLKNLGQDKPPAGFYAGSGGSKGTGGKNPGGFIWPVGTKTGISRCADGPTPHTYTGGGKAIDIYWQPGQGGPYPDIYAVADGEVVAAGDMGGYGPAIIIKHADDLFTLYAHNQELLVKEGDQVSQGDAISKGDSQGNSSGNHLHFEVGDNQNNRTLNPGEWLPDQDNVRTLCGVQ